MSDGVALQLGLPGALIDDGYKVDHYLDRVGGVPCPPPGCKIPQPVSCGVCGKELLQVLQVYAPMDAAGEQPRTLHVLGCCQPGCGQRPEAWAVLRCQARMPGETDLQHDKMHQPTNCSQAPAVTACHQGQTDTVNESNDSSAWGMAGLGSWGAAGVPVGLHEGPSGVTCGPGQAAEDGHGDVATSQIRAPAAAATAAIDCRAEHQSTASPPTCADVATGGDEGWGNGAGGGNWNGIEGLAAVEASAAEQDHAEVNLASALDGLSYSSSGRGVQSKKSRRASKAQRGAKGGAGISVGAGNLETTAETSSGVATSAAGRTQTAIVLAPCTPLNTDGRSAARQGSKASTDMADPKAAASVLASAIATTTSQSPTVLPAFCLVWEPEPGKQGPKGPRGGAGALWDAVAADTVQQLMQHYAREEGNMQESNEPMTCWAGELHEADAALHASTQYIKFAKRLARSPQQCVRYCIGQAPLWPSPTPPRTPSPCEGCGGPRQWELQVLAPLIHVLQEAQGWLEQGTGFNEVGSPQLTSCGPPDSWQWLTLAVATCRQQCLPLDLPAVCIREAFELQNEV